MLPVQIADHRELVSKVMSLTFSCFASRSPAKMARFVTDWNLLFFVVVLLLHNQNPAKYLGDLAKMAVCVFPTFDRVAPRVFQPGPQQPG